MAKPIAISILLFTFILSNSGQVELNKSLGNYSGVQVNGQEFTFTTDYGYAKVIVYSPSVFRIRAVEEKFNKSFSYAVVADPTKSKITNSETADKYIIETDSLILQVNKKPLRFDFYTKENKLINSDAQSFGTSWLGDMVTTYKNLQEGERFLGLGEHTGNLDRRGEAYFNYNTDNPSYDNPSKSMYASIPFYIGIYNDLCYGIFFDNSSRTTFNFGAGNNRFSFFMADCGEMDYYFIYHKNISKIIESYTWLTGRMTMPPLWSLGYQQCRYSYFPDSDVLSTARKFRERNFPVDMIYLDIHYMEDYKLFTWDKERFPDPSGVIKKLDDMSFYTAVIIDPGVKVEEDYPVYTDGLKNDIFVKYPDGVNYQGAVWPGWCHFPDFSMPEARTWWGDWVKTYSDVGITGYWNDMNEIATWGQDIPRLIQFDWEGTKTNYLEAKNVYGLLMSRSSYEGARKNMNGKRPFVLTRAGFSGLQRYTAIWTGDNQANDDHMFLGIRLLNSMGISGLSFSGMDIGGFGGNPSQELYTRWMQIGAFTPMFRGHTAINTNRSEPWIYGEKYEDISRRYVSFRYQLLPYIYSGFYESTVNGMPVLRSLAIDQWKDNQVFDYRFQHQFLFGPALLVVPMKGKEELAKVYLPEGKWYDLFNDKQYNGNQTILTEAPLEKLPLFVKAGSIIPMQKLVETTRENPGDTLFLHIFKGTKENSFVYYEDDGVSYEYEKNEFYKRTIRYNPAKNSVEFGSKEGNYTSKFKVVCMVLHGFNVNELQNFKVNNSSLKVKEDNIRLFTSNFIHADYGPDDTRKVVKASFNNDDKILTINW